MSNINCVASYQIHPLLNLTLARICYKTHNFQAPNLSPCFDEEKTNPQNLCIPSTCGILHALAQSHANESIYQSSII